LSDLSIASKKTEELVKFVYGKLNDVNAQEVIDNVSTKVEASVFIDKILKMLKGSKLTNTNITRLLKISNDQSWTNYLVEAADFSITEESDYKSNEIDTVLWPPEMGHGITIDSDRSSFTGKNAALFTKGFNALKALNKEDKKELLRKLLP